MTTQAIQRSRGFELALWTVQILLAVAFGMAGVMKTFTPLDQLALKMGWVATLPAPVVRFIGLSELAGALGLVLPGLFRIKQQLTPIAAVGLVTVMVLAGGWLCRYRAGRLDGRRAG